MVKIISKVLFSFFLLSLLLLYGCSKDSVTSPESNNKSPFTISGKIENWNYADTISIKAVYYTLFSDSPYVFGSSKVNNDGSFLLNLSSPPNKLLVGYSNGAYTFSDTAAKFVGISGLALFRSDSIWFKAVYNASSLYGQFYNAGEYNIYFEYADRNVVLIGTDHSGFGDPPNFDTVTTQIHINYQEGWNRIKTTVVSQGDHSYQLEREIDNIMDGKWFIQ